MKIHLKFEECMGNRFYEDFSRNRHGENDIPEEIDVEKARYLLSVDDLLEEMLS